MRTDDPPRLVVGCGTEPSTRSKIEALLRRECHLDTLLAGKVTVAVVNAANPWGALPAGADILLHPSIQRGLRTNILATTKLGYEAMIECRHEADFENRRRSDPSGNFNLQTWKFLPLTVGRG